MKHLLQTIFAVLCLCAGLCPDVKTANAAAPALLPDSVVVQQQHIDTITSRLLQLHLAENYTQQELNEILKKMQPDGSFSDIDYADTSVAIWKPVQHLQRLVVMAVSYRKLKEIHHHDQHLLNKLLAGLNFYQTRKPASANWWYRDIGAPQVLMITLLLLKGEIDQPLLMHYSADLKDATGKPAHTGKNRTWVSEITIYKGCIENNYHLIERGFNSIASTLVTASGHNEGIQIDHSFHQHHAQLYEGGYGLSIISDYAKYIQLSRRTVFAGCFTAEKQKLLTQLLLQGHQMLGYRNTIDFGSVGRNITRKNGTANITDSMLAQQAALDPQNAAAYQNWRRHLHGAVFPVQGNTYFWKSDIMVQHGANSYLSAKVISERTHGTESLNGENIKGYNLPLGATNILVSGTEYANIFPVWDWCRIPGTTALLDEQTASLKGYQIGTNQFAGGVSDEKTGVIAYEHYYNELSAKKAYFFFNNSMLCLGAGITSKRNVPVATSINQCRANGSVSLGLAKGEGTLTGSQKSFTRLQWLYHDHVGYIFPNGGNITVKSAVQTGSWRAINTSGDEQQLSLPVFSAWFDHGNLPVNQSYCYMVVPDIGLNDFKRIINNQAYTILRNDTLVQAVKCGSRIWCVFYRPNKLVCPGNFTITSETPAMIMIANNGDNFNITASDPLHRQSNIVLRINRKIKGTEATLVSGSTKLIIPVGDDNLAGKPVTMAYKLSR